MKVRSKKMMGFGFGVFYHTSSSSKWLYKLEDYILEMNLEKEREQKRRS